VSQTVWVLGLSKALEPYSFVLSSALSCWPWPGKQCILVLRHSQEKWQLPGENRRGLGRAAGIVNQDKKATPDWSSFSTL
jgi:hypothetical protein